MNTDIAITLHALLKFDSPKRKFLVAQESAYASKDAHTQPLVLHLSSVPLDMLRKIMRMSSVSDLVFHLPEGALKEVLPFGTSEEMIRQAHFMLQVLFESGLDGYRLGCARGHGALGDLVALTVLSCLHSVGLSEQRGDVWVLTPLGQHLGQVSAWFKADGRVLQQRRDMSVEALSTYEVLQRMAAEGWEHCRCGSTSKMRCPPYVAGDVKRFYSKHSDVTVSRPYLLALLSADTRPTVEHLHFQPNWYYDCMITGRPHNHRRQRSVRVQGKQVFNEDEWPDDEVERVRPGGQRRQARVIDESSQQAFESDGRSSDISDSSSSFAALASSSSSSTTSRSSMASQAESVVLAPNHGVSALPGSSKDQVAPCVEDQGEEAHNVRRRRPGSRNPNAGAHWAALFKLTPYRRPDGTVYSIQMMCKRHNVDVPRYCTKQRVVNPTVGSEEVVRRRLKLWALRGRTVESKEEHNTLWEAIVRLCPDQLPTEAGLEEQLNSSA